jgi:prepilin-type N-terminal cleavage/methylation domain-containing protein/prepilin-type processing-associated H-X9-DG protein
MIIVKKDRRAFTLTELLVVIAIILVLLGLFLPAIQSVRESARRLQCQNNLKQVAIGLHNYHDSIRVLPPAYPGGFDPFLDDKRWGWAAFILPFIEQQPLYNQMDPVQDGLFHVVFNPGKRSLLETPVSTYLCPSDDSGTRADINRDFSGPASADSRKSASMFHLNHLGFRAAKSNYVCNFGAFWRPNYGIWSDMELRGDGVMGCNTKVRLTDISDGTSNTFAIGERSSRNHAAVWAGVEAWNQCTSQGVSMVSGTAYYALNSPASPYPYTCDGVGASGFSSMHPGGANFAMCDGAIRFVSSSIESRNRDRLGKSLKIGLYQRLSSANDQLLVSEF